MKLYARLLLFGLAAWIAPGALAQNEGEVEPVEEVQAQPVESTEGEVAEAPAEQIQQPAPAPAPPRVRPTRPVPAPRPSAGVARPRPVRPRPVPATTAPPITPAGVTPAGQGEGESSGDELTGESATAPAKFDFERAPLISVIESLARLTGRNFQVDPNIAQAEVTVITHDEIPPEMAFQVMESILATYGFSMVEVLEGNLIKIIQTNQATEIEKLPLFTGIEEIPEGYDGYSMHLVDVQYGDPTELQSALQVVGSPNARIDIYLPTGTLIITDTADGLRRMRRLIERVDIPGYDTKLEIFTLEYTRAEVLSTQILEVLIDPEGGGRAGGRQPQRPQPVRAGTRTARPTVPGQNPSQIIGSDEDTLRLVSDERLNALIVVASDGMMERVRDLVARLDTPTPYEANNLHLYELLNADAEMVEQALQPLISTAPRRRGGGGAAGGDGGAQGAEVQPFERQVEITRYDQTNSLLIVASPQDYQVLEAFIARLDLPQRQVHVDAIVMDVTMNDNYTVAVEAAGLTGNDGFGLTSTSRLSELASGLAPVADAAGELVAGPQGALLGSALGLGLGGGLTAGVFDDLEIEVNGVDVKVPFVPLLFQAIETISDVEVLSQPSLMTVDNEEASISVGQEVPFVTNQRRNTGTGDTTTNNNNFSFNNFNSITREDVGVQLTVTPQISEGDNVLLELEIEVSDIAANQIGDVNLLGPTTNKSLIQNKVSVKDGSTAVLAGLIRDITNRDRNQTPVLGDIPVLGWLFRSKGNSRNKRNMVVLVTPHIVKDAIDHQRVTNYKVGEYHDSNIDELFEQGFFRKVKKNFKDRKKHRPTFEKSEAVTGVRVNDSFGRGDMKR